MIILISLSFFSVLGVGLVHREPMVADEVVHYYMLQTQAEVLPGPNIDVHIPMSDWVYERQYPHFFLWHYLGAILWKLFGEGFWVVQLYQALFWLQLMTACYFLLKYEYPDRPVIQWVGMIAIVSFPMHLLFSVLFFQGVPAAAQVVTAVMLLRRNKWLLSVAFMALALSMKVTTFVFLPIYLLLILLFYFMQEKFWRFSARVGATIVLLWLACLPMYWAMEAEGVNYYPATALHSYIDIIKHRLSTRNAGSEDETSSAVSANAPVEASSRTEVHDVQPQKVEKEKIANNPGDLRIARNWLIYFGGGFWFCVGGTVLGCGFLGMGVCSRSVLIKLWPLGVAMLFWGLTAYHMRTAPDARFFLAGFPFAICSLSFFVSAIPWKRVWLPLLFIVSLLQFGLVLDKTLSLRRISPGMQECIAFMESIKGHYNGYFMYPEGHERFISGGVHWDLQYEIRDFWREGNDDRLKRLRRLGVDLIVIKKARIRDVGPGTPDLGAYPFSFVRDIESDDRFEKIFENNAVLIFRVPSKES